MGAALLAKLRKRVWGKSRNVTDNSPTRLETLRAALSHPKHIDVSWVWLAIVILDNVKRTLRGPVCAKFLCKTKKPQSEVVATQVKRKGGG